MTNKQLFLQQLHNSQSIIRSLTPMTSNISSKSKRLHVEACINSALDDLMVLDNSLWHIDFREDEKGDNENKNNECQDVDTAGAVANH